MVQLHWLTPFAQVVREIRIELHISFQESRLAPLARRMRASSDTSTLPEQRIDDERIIGQRKADAFLQSVRYGAVRR